jgi:hypothetical protein
MPGSYAPDDRPIEWERDRLSLSLRQPPDASGIGKAMIVTLADAEATLTISHEISNTGHWPIEIAAWALTIMRPGGFAVLPQPLFRPHDQALRPVRVMALWAFTDLADPRWSIGSDLIILTPRPERTTPQKIGIRNERGWCACVWPEAILIKHVECDRAARYPDGGVNNEVYAEGDYLELETLGATARLEPGESTVHHERWSLWPALDETALHNQSQLHDALTKLAALIATNPVTV